MFLIQIPTYNNIIKVYSNYDELRQKIAKKILGFTAKKDIKNYIKDFVSKN